MLSEARWTDSQAAAITLGGNLVTVNDMDEQQFISPTFGEFGGVEANLRTARATRKATDV